MFQKRYFVKLQLELHAITCPGVWLCKHGFLEVTIKTLGYILRTSTIEPRFPLLAHDKFSIDGYFKSVGSSMDELERVLAAEIIEITLWQNGRRLAYFVGKLADIMRTDFLQNQKCTHDINAHLLMKATPAFPGIIAPKVELTASIRVRDRSGGISYKNHRGNNTSSGSSKCTSVRAASYTGDFIVPNLQCNVTSRKNRHNVTSCYDFLEKPRRQLPVCHTRHFGTGTDASNIAKSSMLHCTPSKSTNLKGQSTPFKANAINHKNTQRRLSNTSGQSFVISRCSSSAPSVDTNESTSCLHTWNSDANPHSKFDEHQNRCEICQNYRLAFMDGRI